MTTRGKFGVGLVLLVVTLPLLGGLMQHRRNQQKAIERVFSDRLSARINSTINDGRKAMLPRVKKDYLNRLKKIDFSGCPSEFNVAWLNYVQSWERFADPSAAELKRQRLLEGASRLDIHANGIGIEHRNSAEAAKLQEGEDTSEAMRKLETVALTYGVDVLKQE